MAALLSRAGGLGRLLAAAAAHQVRNSLQGPFLLVAGLVQPAVFTVVTVRAAAGRDLDAMAVGIGAGLIGIWTVTVWSAGGILRREKWEGTLAGIVVRADLRLVLLGKSVGATAVAVGAIVLSTVTTLTVLGVRLRVENLSQFMLGLALTLVAATVLGIMLSCVFMITRAAQRVSEALLYPVFILGGLLVPLELLPAALRPLAWAVPLYWGGELLRGAARGESAPWWVWVAMLATIAVYAVAGRYVFERVLDRARREGTLEYF